MAASDGTRPNPPGQRTPWDDLRRAAHEPGVDLNRRIALLTIAAVAALTGCTPGPVDLDAAPAGLEVSAVPQADTTVVAPASTPDADEPGEVLAVLATLTVKGKAPMTGYDRDTLFGGWADPDGNGCDARNDVLLRDLTNVALSDDGCTVLTGVLADPYTGDPIDFTRGAATSGAVQIDHVVALANVWISGGQQMTDAQRRAVANDPLNLLSVDGPTNGSKGASNAAEWLPPNRAFRCQYVARQVAVKDRYGLSVTEPERDAMARVLATCPDQPLPTDDTPLVLATAAPADDEPPLPDVEPDPADTEADPQFASCREAKAEGFGPYVAGRDVEYEWYRDGDGDGTVCE